MKTLKLLNVLFILMINLFFVGCAADQESDKGNFAYEPVIRKTASKVDSTVIIGEQLFLDNCATCHDKNMKEDLTGPVLHGSIKRFNNDTLAYLSFVKNSGQYLAKGHDERIRRLFNEWAKSICGPPRPHFDKEDIKAIIAYIEAQ